MPAREYRLIPRTAWRVRGAPDGLPAVADGDLATAWPPESGPGQTEMVLDLGASYTLGRIVWWPAADSAHSPPLAVSESLDRVRWNALGVLPSANPERRPAFVAGGRPFFRPRNGWLEVRLQPRRTRYVRFAPADPAATGSWGIAEVYAYEDAGPRADSRMNADALVATLQAHGIRRLLADPAAAARVARATRGAIGTLTANGYLDNHGRDTPPARLAQAVRIQPTDGLLVPQEDAGDLRTRFAAERVEFREEAAGESVLFYGLSPAVPPYKCARATWSVSKVAAADDPGRYVIEARLDPPQQISSVQFEHPAVSVRQIPPPALAISDDARVWRPVEGVRRLTRWGWAGRTLFAYSGHVDELILPPTAARYVRIGLQLPEGAGEHPIANFCIRGESLP